MKALTTSQAKTAGPRSDGSFYDPYDDMSDDEFERYTDHLFGRREPSIRTTIRLPRQLVERLKAVGASTRTPYQTLIRRVLLVEVAKLERAANRQQSREKSAGQGANRTHSN